MLIYFLLLALAITPVALLFARFEYRRHGKLSTLGLLLLVAMFLASNLILEYATTYEMPSTLLDYVGVLVGTEIHSTWAGLCSCWVLHSMTGLGGVWWH